MAPAREPSKDWRETIAPDEAARFERYAEQLHALQLERARGGPAARALHAKGQLGLEATFEVLPELPEHARVALFARPATYRAYVRFSNGASARQPDGKADLRGCALKLVGVTGKKIIPGMEDAVTQDFLMIRSAATPFRTADEFISVVVGATSPPFGILRAGAHLGFGRLFAILRATLAGFKVPMRSFAETRYFSAVPIKLGPYAVHYALTPRAQAGAAPGGAPDALAAEMTARLARGPVVYDFQVQFFVDETRTPIEDASVEWKEADAPFVTVARVTLPAQDPTSPRGRRLAALVEGFSFDPWHALEELRPLGDIMRARNAAYRVSTRERHAAAEPDGTERVE